MSIATLSQPDTTIGDDELYEVIDGQRVRIPPMAALSIWLAFDLARHLYNFAGATIGRAVTEMLFHLPAPVARDRRPDLAFVSYQKWAKHRAVPYTGGAGTLSLTWRVKSSAQTTKLTNCRTRSPTTFAGVELVWVVYPAQQQVHVYRSQTQITVLTKADTLDGGTVAPGFRLPLVELFTDPAPVAANGDARRS